MVGALILISQVQEGLDADADGFVADFSVMVGLCFLCFGAVLIVVCERKPHMRFLARYEEAAVGLLGLTGTFMLFLLARSGVEETGDNIYAFHNEYWISAGSMKDVIYMI